MKETPTSGPIRTSMIHHARELISSRHSFSRSQTKGVLGKRKKHVFQIWSAVFGEFLDRALAADAAAAQEDEAIAHARGVADLMDREKERAAGGGMVAESGADLAGL